MNRVFLLANLGSDPDSRVTPSGATLTRFRVATNRRWKNNKGDTVEDVQWHSITTWGRTAEVCAQYLKKGHRVLIEGRIEYRQDNIEVKGETLTRYWTNIVAERVQFLTPNGNPREEVEDASEPI